MQIQKKQQKKTDEPYIAPELTKKLVIATKTPSKSAKSLSVQLRKIFSPETVPITEKFPKFKEFLALANEVGAKYIFHVTSSVIKIGVRTSGPTYTFAIQSYEDNFKNFTNEIYKYPPLITFQGDCINSEIKNIFSGLTNDSSKYKRVLHFNFVGDIIHIRHYFYRVTDSIDNFTISLKEIGPRVSLKLVKEDSRFLPDLKC